MTQEQHHETLTKGITKELKPIMDKSPQGIYVYLDDTHKACNKKFADLLGYKSAKEWAAIEAPLADVVEADQDKVIEAYGNATEKMLGSSLDIRFKNVKTGKAVKANMIMVPIAYDGHIFAMHFLNKI
ncbi:MAG TPA: hypothetical protein VJK47_01020 [Dehalococcoidales bacterium]|nr:hypothetical protein [Dehalococcoidales bacterium]